MSTHTPGPWKWYWRKEDNEADCGVFAEPREGQAYAVCRAPRYASRREWEANARLITAAPILLAEAIELLRNATFADGQGIILTQDAEALETAIAKATQP